jgi:hypothetical protein
MTKIQHGDDIAIAMPESPASTLSTIPEEIETGSSDSSASPIPSTDMAEGWYDYEGAEKFINLFYPEIEPLYLPPEQDS